MGCGNQTLKEQDVLLTTEASLQSPFQNSSPCRNLAISGIKNKFHSFRKNGLIEFDEAYQRFLEMLTQRELRRKQNLIFLTGSKRWLG